MAEFESTVSAPSPVRTCADCDAPLAGPGSLGLCPKCLLGAGLGLLLDETGEEAARVLEAKAPSSARFGDYELLEEIARGGMGIVYRARQISLDRVVAVKMLLFGQFSSDEFVRRFRAEAEAAAALQHPNIVAIYEIGNREGMPFFSMAYVDGRSLADIIKDGPRPAREVAGWLSVLARAVHYAHQRGVLHRDLKPSNVLLDAHGTLHLTDFGLAKRCAQGGELTSAGQVIGTPNYMPPEQASADRGPTGPASDVYSLGAILYHLLTGRPPVMADSLESTLLAVLQDEPIALRLLNRGIPRDLETICLKCLQKNPQRRYDSAAALVDDLDRHLNGMPIAARPIGIFERTYLWCRRKPAVALAVALLVLTAAGSALTARHLSLLNGQARWDAYVSEMSRAQNEWRGRHFAEAYFHLQRQIPRRSEEDLRGFEWRHLWHLAQGNAAYHLPHHPDVVNWLSFSADSHSLASFSWDATNGVEIWDVVNHRLRFALRDAISVGGFSADGKLFVTGRADRAVMAHDAQTGRTIQVWPGVGELVAFAPASLHVITMPADRILQVRENLGGRIVMSLTNSTRRFFDAGRNAPVAISSDGHWLALVRPGDPSSSKDRGVELWDVAAGVLKKFLGLERQVRLLQFSPGREMLAVADGEGGVEFWEWGSNERRSIHAHALPIQSLAFSANGETLASGAHDEEIKLWDVASLQQKPARLEGQIGAVWALAFSPDQQFLASGSRDVPIPVWNLTAAPASVVLTNLNADKVGNFAFSPSSRLMAGGCQDNQVRIWNVKTLQEEYRLPGVSQVVAFNPNGTELLVAETNGAAHWWDFERGARRAVSSFDGLGDITALEASPDRRTAALGHKNGRIQVLEIKSGKLLGSYEGHHDAILSIRFAPDGRTFASGGRDKELRLWDVGLTQESRRVCAEHKGGVSGLAISGNGRRMVSGCSANTIKFWDLQHPDRSLGARTWHRSAIRTLAFSPNGERVVSGSEDHSVKLWDFATRRELASFEFAAPVQLVAFSPDSNVLAVVTEKGALHLLLATALNEAEEKNGGFFSHR